MKISLGSDHGGVDLKDAIAEYLKSKGYVIKMVSKFVLTEELMQILGVEF